MLTGGWEYIWGAYGVTWTLLLIYGVSLYQRLRRSGGG